MSAPAYTSPFRRRTLGRAPSPPTWACYEQISYDDEYSDESASDCEDDDNSCSEDDEEYGHAVSREEMEDDEPRDDLAAHAPLHPSSEVVDNMDVDDEGDSEKSTLTDPSNAKKDIKGKQRAVEPAPVVEAAPPPPPKKQLHAKKRRQQAHALRPILTIQRSQGFVWNQVSLLIDIAIRNRR